MTAVSDRPRRSALYLPASNARALAKARELPCDVVILDLEDAVAPEAKGEARAAAAAAAREDWGGRELVVRVNGLSTPWGEADLAAVAGAPFDAVLAPKIAGPGDLDAYAAALGGRPLWAMVETAAALFALEPIAARARDTGLAALVVGTNDLALETGWRLAPGRAAFLPALAMTVAAARLHGLAVLDGVFNGLDDEAGLAAECAQGAELGFDGKTVIHPRQIEAASSAFQPSEAELAHARAVVAAFADPAAAGRGAVRLEGRMVERLHLAAAERLLSRAGARPPN